MSSQLLNHIQNDFSGGVISPKMLLRQDTEIYRKSALELTNWLQTPLGSAVRMPGTKFLQVAPSGVGRIIPYLTTANERSLILLTPGNISLINNVDDRINSDVFDFPVDPSPGVQIYRKEVVFNHDFREGLDGWTVDPNQYFSKNGDGPLGVWVNPANQLLLSPRLYRYPNVDYDVVYASGTAEVDVATNVITVSTTIEYFANPDVNSGGFVLNVKLSPNANLSSPIIDKTWTEVDYPVAGATIEFSENFDLPTTDWTGTLYFTLTATARATVDREYSNPQFKVYFFSVLANGEVELVQTDLASPYGVGDLKDIHYVQSPYGDKEIVFTHPKYPPRRFYFDTGLPGYVFEDIPFTNTPSVWADNNYPAACTSIQGRLVLAGGQTFRTSVGDPVATVSETIWATEVGNWETFTTASSNPSDSLELVAIYRSPIQWVYGHKNLLIGAQEFEYNVTAADRILTPTDYQVNLQSTHGSNNVQPAGFGEGVMFPGDAGSRLRFIRYSDESNGWISQDMSVLFPEACFTGIKRMVRVRNPHQMCWVLRQDGQIAIFSSESGVEGWCVFKCSNGDVKDICVMTDGEGRDVPYMLVKRNIEGVNKLYLECIPKFSYQLEWTYMDSYVEKSFETPTSVIAGLDHLEGKLVQVLAPNKYLGSFLVESGTITLSDDTGQTTPVIRASIGMAHPAIMKTLPPSKVYPGSPIRFSAFAVRILNSTRPIINGNRPDDRDPLSQLNQTQPLDEVNDLFVNTDGWDPYKIIEIIEQVPMRSEILGVYGRLRENKV